MSTLVTQLYLLEKYSPAAVAQWEDLLGRACCV